MPFLLCLIALALEPSGSFNAPLPAKAGTDKNVKININKISDKFRISLLLSNVAMNWSARLLKVLYKN